MINPKKNEIDQWGPIDARVLYPSFWWEATAYGMPNRYGMSWPHYFGIFEKERVLFFWQKRDMEASGINAIEKWILPAQKRNQLWAEYQQALERAEGLQKLIKAPNVSRQELVKLGERCYDAITEVHLTTLVPELANYAATAYLSAMLNKVVKSGDIDHLLEILLRPESLSFHQSSEIALLELYTKLNYKFSARDFIKYAESWSWLESSYYENKKLSPQYFFNQVKNLHKREIENRIKKAKNHREKVVRAKEAAAAKYKLGKKVLQTAQKLSFSIWWQDNRKGILWKIQPTVDIISDMAKKYHPSDINDLYYYTAEEWLAWIKTGRKLRDSELAKRKKIFVVSVNLGELSFFTGAKAQKIKGLLKVKKAPKIKELKGTTVSRGDGKVMGKARIVLSPRGVKMGRDEILVAPMTSPEYIMLMRQASAIVTDVGGLMSHAAVVSRELGKPCIVNTRVATKALKTGDMVEVDVKTGIVRKLN